MSKSVYGHAAEAGIGFGIYLTVMSFSVLFSLRFPGIGLLFPVLLLLFPFLMGRGMSDMRRQNGDYGKFSAMWLFGIYEVIYGTLICSFLSGLWLVFGDPGFVREYAEAGIRYFENAGVGAEGERAADVLRHAMESHLLPSGMELVVSLAWATAFTGSIVSMILAAFLSAKTRRDRVRMFR